MHLALTLHLLVLTPITACYQQALSGPDYDSNYIAGMLSETEIEYHEGWRLELHRTWDVLGPFPQHAREQHFLSPAYPLDLSNGWNIEGHEEYPSAFVDGGIVRWTQMHAVAGSLAVSFPEVRWQELRYTEGWAALQHHAVLHSQLTVTPPADYQGEAYKVPTLRADIKFASYFALIPSEPPLPFAPAWHTANIYNLPKSPVQLVPFPTHPTPNQSTTYHIVASGDYEVRLFGDPMDVEGQPTPIQRLSFDFSLGGSQRDEIVLDHHLDIVPEFVGGWALAADGALGVGVRADDGWWEVSDITWERLGMSFHAELASFRLAPYQSRILPIRMHQTEPITSNSISFSIAFKKIKPKRKGRSHVVLNTTLPIRQREPWNGPASDEAYQASYFLGGTPTYFMAKPPRHPDPSSPAILALHGSGVEADSLFWTDALPRHNSSWIIFPMGGTSWGYDWHGPSTLDIWGSLEAFGAILESNSEWHDWLIEERRVILVGHSNGGQGVWYQAGRYPDRVLAAVPAAAFVKSQLYVSTSFSHGAHFTDATLRDLLEASMQPDDNDLYLSNLVSIPILSIHGGNDRNVPTWHSRQLYTTLKQWYPHHSVKYYEVANKPHWWDSIFSEPCVQQFLHDPSLRNASDLVPSSFMVTSMVPEESGTLHGFRIHQLQIPGRLARLEVEGCHTSKIRIRTVNVWEFSVNTEQFKNVEKLVVDGTKVSVSRTRNLWLSKMGGKWHKESFQGLSRPVGPANRILNSKAPFVIVIPTTSPYNLFAAQRMAHNLLSYLRIDAQIFLDREAIKRLGRGDLGCANIAILGGHDNLFGEALMSGNPGSVVFTKGGWRLRGREFEHPGQGISFLHSHPTCATGLTLFLSSTDEAGLERILKLFPLRTGVPVPEWIITGPESDFKGSGGLLGAGWWGRYWEWSEGGSWLGVE